MGLDQYLMKTKRYKNTTLQDIVMAENYMDWLNYKSNNPDKQYSLKEWCGITLSQVPPKNVIEFYKNERMTEVGYWRKANQVHNWFVENVQDGEDDCGYYEVSKEQLEELLDICKKIVDSCKLVDGKVNNGNILVDGEWKTDWVEGKVIDNFAIAKALLPTRCGFFFGSTDYDEYYLGDIEDTLDILTKVLDTTDFDNEMICYTSSW